MIVPWIGPRVTGMQWWGELMLRLGGGLMGHVFTIEYMAILRTWIGANDLYPYEGMDFKYDPNLPTPLGKP